MLSGARSLVSATPARFFIRIDNQEIETSAITCVIGNVVGMGPSGFYLAPGVMPDDGQLDVVTIRNVDLPSLVSVTASVFARADRAIKACPDGPDEKFTSRPDHPSRCASGRRV